MLDASKAKWAKYTCSLQLFNTGSIGTALRDLQMIFMQGQTEELASIPCEWTDEIRAAQRYCPEIKGVNLPAREAVIIPVKTLTGDSFDRLVRLLSVFHADYSADKNLRTIIVYAPKDVVEQMRKVVNELDRPGSEAAIGRNIDMTMTFLNSLFVLKSMEIHYM